MKKIFYQGVPGSFSFIAARDFFGQKDQLIGVDGFKKIFLGVLKNENNFGVLPIENSTIGSIYENLDLLEEFYQKIKVVGEIYLKVEHHLLGVKSDLKKEERLRLIKKVYSHPKALEQCSLFFSKNPGIEKNVYSDTAGAAQFIALKKDVSVGAIASKQAGEVYQLEVIKENIEDSRNNYTRFLIITQKKTKVSFGKPEKLSLIFNLKHQPGTLASALLIFKKYNLNLTKIQSRPIINNPFEYNFFVDLEFNTQIEEMKKILKEFEKYTTRLIVLGFYLKGKWQ